MFDFIGLGNGLINVVLLLVILVTQRPLKALFRRARGRCSLEL